MKKRITLVLALLLALSLIALPALADETPQPEGGSKFETNWGKMCGLIEIYYEEEGYRVSVDLYNEVDQTGTLWEYSCYYNEEKDVLESISSRKIGYTVNLNTLDKTFGEPEYEGIDEENQTSEFSIAQNGALTWKDGHENWGQDLEFRNIGRFDGVWKNEEAQVYTEFWWQGLYDENTYCYSVYIHRGGDDQYADFHMEGLYDPDTNKLTATGTVTTTVRNEAGEEETQEDEEIYDAVFSPLGDGKILFETENGIELEYDLLGPES